MYNPDYINWGANQGWICGSCGRSFAPHVSECPYCNKERRTFSTTSATVSSNNIEWWKGSTTDADIILNNLKTSTTSQKEGL